MQLGKEAELTIMDGEAPEYIFDAHGRDYTRAYVKQTFRIFLGIVAGSLITLSALTNSSFAEGRRNDEMPIQMIFPYSDMLEERGGVEYVNSGAKVSRAQ